MTEKSMCHSYLKSCHFQSALFLTDSQLALRPSLLSPSVSPTKILLVYLGSFRLPLLLLSLSFPWVPGHAGLPGNEWADSIAKTGATLPVTQPCSLPPGSDYCTKIRHTRYSFWRRTLSHNSFSCQIPSVFSEELALPRLIHCELSRLRCHGHSLLLSSYLCRIKWKENFSMDTLCRIWLTSSLTFPHSSLSGVPSSAPLLPFWTSGPDLGAWPDCLVSVEFLHAPIPWKESGSTTTRGLFAVSLRRYMGHFCKIYFSSSRHVKFNSRQVCKIYFYTQLCSH